MIQDLHAHTFYSSYCGRDCPETIVEAAIAGGVTQFGISDHAGSIVISCLSKSYDPNSEEIATCCNQKLRHYFDQLTLVRDRYADRIAVLRGIELATDSAGWPLPWQTDVSYFDFALIEHIDLPNSISGGDLLGYAEWAGCKCGVAHTDLFAFAAKRGEDPLAFFTAMAERGIFWEMNINYDTLHGHRIYPYMLAFFDSEEQQDIVRRAGLEISIGFDGHRVEDYRPDRVREYNRRLEAMGIPRPFSYE